jgi:hypothetical protein
MSIRLSQGTLTSRQHQLPRPEPDGQPIESSQLAKYRDVREAITSHIHFGNQFVAFSTTPVEGRVEALKKIIDTLSSMSTKLKRGDPTF